jgi:hypothetical protein
MADPALLVGRRGVGFLRQGLAVALLKAIHVPLRQEILAGGRFADAVDGLAG